jgi:hypothetical protein
MGKLLKRDDNAWVLDILFMSGIENMIARATATIVEVTFGYQAVKFLSI